MRKQKYTIDVIIRYKGGIVLVKRAIEPELGKWALPGGHVELDETLEHAAVREAKEETGLDITLIRQLHTYSDPKRDPRNHVKKLMMSGSLTLTSCRNWRLTIKRFSWIITMENIEEWLDGLKTTSKAIIVEGPNDKKALEHFGIRNIFVLSRQPMFAVMEDVASQFDDAIILTDYDKKGRIYYGKLSRGLQSLGVRIDNVFREFLYHKKLSHIEGLVNFVER